ncbi:MAG: DUF2383 domain-containing protein [Pseudomonadota bacterium]
MPNLSLTEPAIDAVQTVLTRSIDAQAGFDTMVEKAEPEFKPVAEQFLELHDRHVQSLASTIEAAGRAPRMDGSAMSPVNEAVVSLRAFFDEIDADVIDNIRSGEGYILSAFDDAITELADGPAQDRLTGLRAELQALLDKTEDID